jgi:Sigma-70, region 4
LDWEADEIEDTSSLALVSLCKKATVEAVREAIAALPVDFREVVVLRELEGLSYKEISQVSGVPLGTVMSRLARARHQLYLMLSDRSSAPNYELPRMLRLHRCLSSRLQPCPSTQQVVAEPSAQQPMSAARFQ